MHRQPAQTQEPLITHGVPNVLRHELKRALTELGAWPSLYWLKGDVYSRFIHSDGHCELEAMRRD